MSKMDEPQSKKSKYNHQWKHRTSKRAILDAGLKGFLCTSNFSEKGCVREAYNLLNATADELYPDTSSKTEEESTVDVSDDLEAEIQNSKPEKQWRFQAIDTGAKNVAFIKTTLEDPVLLVNTIANEIYNKKDQKTQHLLRLIPIENVSKATVEAISAAIDPLLDKHFLGSVKTFGIVINKRFNNALNKMEIIDKVAAMVTAKNAEHKVNLKQPEVTILLEVIKSWCLIAILPEFQRLRKYNLIELSIDPDHKAQETKIEEKMNNE